MSTIKIPPSPIHAQPDPALNKFFDVTNVAAGTRPLTMRGEGAPPDEAVKTHDDDIVEADFENGIRIWMRADDYAESSEFLPKEVARGKVLDWIAKKVHVMRLNPVELAGEIAGEAGAMAIIRHFEKQLDPAPGLYRIGDVFTQNKDDQITRSSDLDGSDSILLFLHGTASSTSGSFRALSLASGQTELSIIRNTTPEWRKLRERYKNRILAFEHRTLSQSPIDNARELAELLPKGANLHLVSHSRGGLVGELLCITQELSDDHVSAFRDRGRIDEAKKLQDLANFVRDKDFKIQRFVRVACPARGTILASGRLDIYLSVILNLAGVIPGFAANPFFEFFKAASVQLIKSRTKPEEVPGVEAMMPESPLVHVLNLHGLQSQADLAVIAGDQQGDNLLTKLRDLVTRLYYWEDHDLIVNTDSMYRGMGRKQKSFYFFDRGPDVNHFQYFTNHKTRDLLINWLTFDQSKLSESGFKELTAENLALEQTARRGAAPSDAPHLVFIPGFMGTHLGDSTEGEGDENRIWLRFDALAIRGADHLAAMNTVQELLGPPYQGLISFLQNSYQVRPFPYDWRKSAEVNGAELDCHLSQMLQDNRPIHIVSHSTGGYLVRALPPDTWEKLKSRGGHWVELGGAPHGIPAAVGMISGDAPIVRLLQMLDYAGRDRLPELFASWPGVLEMLPEEFLLSERWRGLNRKPDSNKLADAARVRSGLHSEYESLYVAGQAARTPVYQDGVWSYSMPGDGRVLQASLPQKNVWYVPAAHGDLANQNKSFAGILDLLQKSGTDQLVRRPAISNADLGENDGPILFPQETDLIDAALGGKNTRRATADIASIKVSVVHGDLSKATYPVIVGHYSSDTIVSAERRLDSLLNQAISKRFLMRVYPGPLGTSDIVRLSDVDHPGAIIVGLGDVGKLTEDKLRATVMQAVLRYALTLAETPGRSDGQWQSAAVTSLLIGTYGGETIDVQGSVAAIVRAAVDANRVIRQQKLWDRVRIDEVQFFEAYEDLATQAIHAVNRLGSRLRLNLNNDERVDPTPFLVAVEGKRDKRPPDQYSNGWWRRIEVTGDQNRAGDLTLRFNVLTDRARSEESTTTAQTRRVETFVRKLIDCPDFEGRAAVTLYELLVPKRIKEHSNDLANLVLEVDRNSAQFPWELMSRRSGNSVLPFAANVGLIRQYKTGGFEDPRSTRENTALVAAFPKVEGFPELDGAASEATEIHAQLEAAGYEVYPAQAVAPPGDNGVISALYTGDYRILHLAGHGVVEIDNKTGLVMGANDVLTADDVRNLPSAPDLAFLNCCHLGRIDPQLDRNIDPRFDRKLDPLVNRLAASLSEAFIQIGCRAVVAAGWAVNDKAAVSFAREFYNQMLSGETFGRSVLEARRLVRREHPETNTWGAYQCYGNPDYRLRLTGAAVGTEGVRTPRTRTEFIESCRSLRQDIAAAEDGLKATDGLLHNLPVEWRDGWVLSTFGDTYAYFGAFEKAISLYKEAVANSGADAPIWAIQNLSNLLDRHAKTLKQKAAQAEAQEKQRLLTQAQSQTDEAIKRIEWLLMLGETSDRYSNLGGLYRRLALFDNRTENLRKALEAYDKAHHIALEATGEIYPYPALNWITLRFILGEPPAALEQDLPAIMKACAEQKARLKTFWSKIGYPDSLLVGAVIRGNLADDKDKIKKLYMSALRDGANQAQIESLYGGIVDTRDLLADESAKTMLSDIAEAVNEMRVGPESGLRPLTSEQ